MPKPARPISLCVLATSACALLALGGTAESAATLKTLHAFCAKQYCADGATPQYPPVADGNGVLYGTASDSDNGSGLAYSLTPNGSGGYTYSVLYRFCSVAGCTDGTTPSSPLVLGSNGHLYGTTFLGGAHNSGVLFELKPNADRTAWKEVVRYSFCPAGDPCVDGKYPTGALTYPGAHGGALYNGTSGLYGTTRSGGTGNSGNGAGTAFRIKPVAGQTTWPQSVIYNFCSQPNCADGATPETGLAINGSGSLFGTTVSGGIGGVNGWGTVFQIDLTQRTETVVYMFCQIAGCADGRNPSGPLLLGPKGLLYGVTENGGANNHGTIFKIDPAAASNPPTLYDFCSAANCADGTSAMSGLAMNPNGNLFGMTQYGGSHSGTNCEGTGYGCGIVFRLHPQTSNLTVLHSFCGAGLPGCWDGAEPLYGSLYIDAAGNVFGVTSKGGKQGYGTVFELTP